MQSNVRAWMHGHRLHDLTLVLVSCIASVAVGWTALGFQQAVRASTFLAVRAAASGSTGRGSVRQDTRTLSPRTP